MVKHVKTNLHTRVFLLRAITAGFNWLPSKGGCSLAEVPSIEQPPLKVATSEYWDCLSTVNFMCI